MTTDPNNPQSRLKNILSSADEQTESPLSRLPKAKATPPPAHSPAPVTQAPPPTPTGAASPSRGERVARAFWTVTGAISLVVNAILIAVVIYLLTNIINLQLTANDAGSTVLAGFYNNFELMDRASIKTTIPVDAQIPLNITVPIQKSTSITLANDTVIPNAHVRINTGALNIDAPAEVTLPAGTSLNVTLNFDVPVQDTIPIHVDVPVNIPLAQTDLHTPFIGLQQVVKPFYCLVEPNAINMDGLPVCP